MKRPIDITCQSQKSLVHIGSLDSFDLTPGGIEAARQIIAYFESGDKSHLEKAVQAYDLIIPNENFGGEYTALRWICLLLMAPSQELTEHFDREPTVESWYQYLSANDFEKLRLYINYKYHFKDMPDGDAEAKRMLRFLEDFILFSNPDRERWEKTSEILFDLRIEAGKTIADVGCGSGYYSFKFADMVGPGGKVYGIEINPLHLDYLHRYVERHDIRNVEIVESNLSGIGLSPDIKVDMVFSCSLFHVLYASFPQEERRQFIESIAHALRPDGSLIVIDNELVEDGDLPYHGPYIASDLLISQLYYYGFRLDRKVAVTKQRYALVFKRCEAQPLEDETDLRQGTISALSGASLVKYALSDAAPTAGYTENGQRAAGLLLRALTHKQPADIEAARAYYESILQTERIGDEYTAFIWFCEYLQGDASVRARMLQDPLGAEYFAYLAGEDFSLLKRYLICKYELPEAGGQQPFERLMQVSEYIAFNNPNRDRWEKTNEMLRYLSIQPGEVIADVGCGSGYFTYRFARQVGPGGKVYATEINKGALFYVEAMRERYGLNIEPIVSALNDARLPMGQMDKVFMCSMYHAVYVASIEFVKDAFIASIKSALKDDGELIVVDNEIAVEGVPDYYGSGIDRRLIISQLAHYGFQLVDEKQFIPQRYILIFRKERSDPS